MSRSAIFCSYARQDAEVVRSVAADLDQLGQTVWFDQKLTGGQSWWNTILEQIRGCDCFLFAISEASLHSRACRAELDYAHRLGRTILPVAAAPVLDQLLPPFLAETQRVPAGDTRRLARALLALSPPGPLPDPRPEPPPVPITYLVELGDMVDRPELTLPEQRNLLGELKVRMEDPDEAEAATALLRRLRRHPSVNAWVADEIDTALAAAVAPLASPPSPAKGTPVAGTPADGSPASPAGPAMGTRGAIPDPGPVADRRRVVVAPSGPPPPLPPRRTWAPDRRDRRSTGRRGLVVALIVVVALAAAGAAVWRLGSGGTTPADVPTTEPVPQDGGGGGGDGGGQIEDTTTSSDTTETTDTTDTTDTTVTTDPSVTGDAGATG